jgi:hypothetical protein
MKVTKLPQTGLCNSNADIAEHLETLAEQIGGGQWEDVRNVFVVIEDVHGRLGRCTYGQPCDLARAVGVLQIAITRAAESQ